ncbi:hypothetical protein [Methanolobus sp. WCC4]|uniref:hypothetical protein n=1 Tax=Methanolobus sp. WCC4 TaxID=3125784 RepID=UPI0030F96799
MARTHYSVRQNDRGLSVCIPKEAAVALGIVGLDGTLLQSVVKVDLSPDRSSLTIKPYSC